MVQIVCKLDYWGIKTIEDVPPGIRNEVEEIINGGQ